MLYSGRGGVTGVEVIPGSRYLRYNKRNIKKEIKEITEVDWRTRRQFLSR